MKVKITFIPEEGDGESMEDLGNHSIDIAGVDKIKVSTPIDIGYDFDKSVQTGVHHRFPLETGGIELSVHGERPVWS
jgi:hypothetical protein